VLVGGKVNGEGKESEYSQCTFYTCMKIEHWNLSKSF
jgi:hypothetical protein